MAHLTPTFVSLKNVPMDFTFHLSFSYYHYIFFPSWLEEALRNMEMFKTTCKTCQNFQSLVYMHYTDT